jgi:tetratricopeptide (TPR) repeat protein
VKRFALAFVLLACRPKQTAPDAAADSGTIGCEGMSDEAAMYKRGSDLVEPYMALQGRERKNDATREKNLRAGIACMDQVVAKSPKSWSAFWVRGKAHQALGDHGSAEQSFQAAYDIKPDEIDVGRELGLEELELNQWGKASRVFQVLVDGHPTDAGMRANLALSFLLDGDPKRAKAEITQARKLEPNDPVSKKVEERIDEVASGKRPQPTSLREIER